MPNKVIMYSDEELVEAIVKTSQVNLFEKLYDRYAERIYNTCFYYTKSQSEAEDLTQDIFVKLYLNLSKYNNKSKFSTWLYSFSKNHCINYLRRNNSKKIQRESIYYLNIENFDLPADIECDNHFLIEHLALAMESLSNSEKKILSLKYKEAMSIKEISESLMIGESAVKMRLSRAKSHLKMAMPIAV